ncbi:MAG: MauE/DoxX family redox-associated membrane protein [Vicinamibacteria bacterium]
MLEVAVRLVLGGLLAGASVAKLASPGSSRAAMATFGIAGRRAQSLAWGLLIAAELGLAAGVIAGSSTAAYLAAALMATFAATMVAAIMRGRAGAPCACFGARSTVGWPSVARNAALAVAFAALPALPGRDLSTDEWLGLGLAVALLACAGLGVAVLALAREVGLLRLRLGPGSALELPDEGPLVFRSIDLISRFRLEPETTLALAVFVSEGCHVCRSLEPSLRVFERDPLVALESFEEDAETAVWAELEIPGSPFAIALDREGTVLAKGTFNNLSQLESVLATAERRREERRIATGVIGA